MTGRWTPAYDRLFDPDHELAGDPACMRWAWLDLCHLTQKEDTVRVVKMRPTKVRRGEFLASVRFLAERWGWSKSRVQRFLDLLKSPEVGKLEEVASGHSGTVYRVKSHEAYALRGTQTGQVNPNGDNGLQLSVEDARDTDGTPTGHQRDTNGTNTRSKEVRDTRDNTPEPAGPVAGMWEIWLAELGGTGRRPRLTDKRRQKLKALYDEQLKDHDDPLGLFRRVLLAIKKSDHHMSNRDYQWPESTFCDESRRDRWAQAALNSPQAGFNGFMR